MPAFNLALNVASATELLVARALEVDDGREAALGALWGGAAALLEWLAARAGTHEWRRVSKFEELTVQSEGDVILYDVCSQPVSLHLPLHRFVAAAALKAAAVGLDPLPPLASAAPRDRKRVVVASERLEDLSDDEDDDTESSPVVRYVNHIIQSAVRDGASDIHIEPEEQTLRVRFRIDGVLYEVMNPPRKMHASITSRIKIMAQLDIAEVLQDELFNGNVERAFAVIALRTETLKTQGLEAIGRPVGIEIVLPRQQARQIGRHHRIGAVNGNPGNLDPAAIGIDHRQPFDREGVEARPAVVDNWWRQGMMGGAKAHYDGIKAFSETDFTEDLKAIDVPTLVMHGDDDQIVPIDASAKLAVKLLKKGELKIYPGFSHGMATVNADVINRDLLAFIKG